MRGTIHEPLHCIILPTLSLFTDDTPKLISLHRTVYQDSTQLVRARVVNVIGPLDSDGQILKSRLSADAVHDRQRYQMLNKSRRFSKFRIQTNPERERKHSASSRTQPSVPSTTYIQGKIRYPTVNLCTNLSLLSDVEPQPTDDRIPLNLHTTTYNIHMNSS